MLLVISRLLTTVCRILSTSPSGRQQSGAFQAFDYVVFRLLLPFALGGQRSRILRGRRIVFHAIHADVGKFVVRAFRPSGYIPTYGSAP